MFKECGKNVNVETGASFGYGAGIKIGDNSGLGISCRIPNNIHIGNNVMMGPHVTIYSRNHAFERIDLPMNKQGFGESKQTIIEDDVWIGSHVIMTPGRHIKKGTIIGAGTVLTKDFPEYSVVGGNPGKLLKKRKNNNNPEKDHSTFDV
jgi:maltose O-acetyltransferase